MRISRGHRYDLLLQIDMDRDRREQRDHDNLNENEGERKLGMDFRNLSHHRAMDHSTDADTEVLVLY